MKTHTFSLNVLTVSAPERTNSTFGRWICHEKHSSPFGTAFFSARSYFWRKAEAMAYFNAFQASKATAQSDPYASRSVDDAGELLCS